MGLRAFVVLVEVLLSLASAHMSGGALASYWRPLGMLAQGPGEADAAADAAIAAIADAGYEAVRA